MLLAAFTGWLFHSVLLAVACPWRGSTNPRVTPTRHANPEHTGGAKTNEASGARSVDETQQMTA